MPRRDVVDAYFLEHRAKLIDIAAFLDRLDRAQGNTESAATDHRIDALLEGLRIVIDGEPERARRVLELMSDPEGEPVESAQGLKGATGASGARAEGKDSGR